MSIQLSVDFVEFEKWLTPEVVYDAFSRAGYEVELKDEYKKECRDQQKVQHRNT